MTASPTLVAGRYRLIETLGVGGMGRVWHAWDQTLGRDVAIKEIVPPAQLLATERDELRRRTLREARAAARLNHPSVVRVYDVFETNGRPWIVMEFVQARSLHDILASDGPLDPVRAAGIGLALLGALRAAHRAGVMHRDVKPSNVLLGDDDRVVLTDFGIATLEGDPGVTRPGLVLGSPAYISPERARDGTAGPESDLWSLGATLYAAVEGKAPFERNSAIATLTALASEEVEPPPNAGPLRWVLNGLLRKDPEARIDAAEAERRLRRAAAGGPVGGAGRKFRWPWTKASADQGYRPPRQGGAGVDGPVSGAPVSGGPVAGRPVSGGPVAGRPVSGGPVAGRPVSGGPVAGRPVSGGPVAGRPVAGGAGSGGRPRFDGFDSFDGPGAGNGSAAGNGSVARGRAAAPGPVAGGPAPGGPPAGRAAVGRAGVDGVRPDTAGSDGARPDTAGPDGARPRGERSDGARSGRHPGSGTGPLSTGASGGTTSTGSRPRGSASVPPTAFARVPVAPPAPTPRVSEPTAPVSAPGAPESTAPVSAPGALESTAPVSAPGAPAARSSAPQEAPAPTAPAPSGGSAAPDVVPPAALAEPRAASAPAVESPAAPVSPADGGAAGPRSAPPSWPVPRFEATTGRSAGKPDPQTTAPVVPTQRPAVEDNPAVESPAVDGAATDTTATDTTATDSAAVKSPAVDSAAVESPAEAGTPATASTTEPVTGSATTEPDVEPVTEPDVEPVAEPEPAPTEPATEPPAVEAGPASADAAAEPAVEAGPVSAAAEPAAVETVAEAAGGSAAAAPAGVSAGGRAGKGRKGGNRRGRNREPETTQLAEPAAADPETEQPKTEEPKTKVPAVEVAPAVAVEAGKTSAEPTTAPEIAAAPKVAAPESAASEAVAPKSVEAEAEAAPQAPAAGDAPQEPFRPAPPGAGAAPTPRDDSGRDGSARRTPPRAGSTDDATTSVAAPGLALLGPGQRARPGTERDPAESGAGAPQRVRAQAQVVPAGPEREGGRRKRILVLVAAVLVVIAAVVFMVTRKTGGEGAPRDQVGGGSPVASSAGPVASQQQPTTSEPAAAPNTASPTGPTSPTSAATAQPGARQRPPLPPGWRLHTDPTGFSVYVPAHWTESRKDGIVYFRGDGRALGIDQTNEPKADPVADWTAQRNYRRSKGEFPGYAEVKIAEVPYFKKAADWEFTYNGSSGRRHVSNRGVIVGPERAHGFWWETSDADWATAAHILDIVYASFEPDPSKVG